MLRVPGTVVYPAILLLLVFAVAEIGQRVSDWRKWSRRQSKPFTATLETADGSLYGERKEFQRPLSARGPMTPG